MPVASHGDIQVNHCIFLELHFEAVFEEKDLVATHILELHFGRYLCLGV